eukprot:586815-Pyramimonas_sp.AAC.1
MTRHGCCIDLYLKLACVSKLVAILGLSWGSLGALSSGPPGALSRGFLEVLLGPSRSPHGGLLGRLGALLGV